MTLPGMDADIDTAQLRSELCKATGYDIRLDWSTKHFGKKTENPLDYMRFVIGRDDINVFPTNRLLPPGRTFL